MAARYMHMVHFDSAKIEYVRTAERTLHAVARGDSRVTVTTHVNQTGKKTAVMGVGGSIDRTRLRQVLNSLQAMYGFKYAIRAPQPEAQPGA